MGETYFSLISACSLYTLMHILIANVHLYITRLWKVDLYRQIHMAEFGNYHEGGFL